MPAGRRKARAAAESGLALNLVRALSGLFGNSLPSTSESASSKACTWPDCRNDDRRARLRASWVEDQDPFRNHAPNRCIVRDTKIPSKCASSTSLPASNPRERGILEILCDTPRRLRAVKAISLSQSNVGYGAASGPSRGDSCRRAIRPTEPSTVAIRKVRSNINSGPSRWEGSADAHASAVAPAAGLAPGLADAQGRPPAKAAAKPPPNPFPRETAATGNMLA